MTESFVVVPSPTDAPEAALHSSHCPLVHQVDPSTTPERDPAMLCFADSGLADAWAGFACALGTLHTQECNSFLPVLLQGEIKPELAQLHQQVLLRRLEGIRLGLELVQLRIQAVQELSSKMALFASRGAAWRTELQQISVRFGDLLDSAGMVWDERGSLAGWVAFVQFALQYWQQRRSDLYVQLVGVQQAQELLSLQSDTGTLISSGALRLLEHLENQVQSAPGRERTIRHLQGHAQQPLGKSWFWMLDCDGECDDEE